ncbi:hypothetical protein D3C84_748620 [compost metagenome]
MAGLDSPFRLAAKVFVQNREMHAADLRKVKDLSGLKTKKPAHGGLSQGRQDSLPMSYSFCSALTTTPTIRQFSAHISVG